MARTPQGRRLTEAHKQTQIRLGTTALTLGAQLLAETVDPQRLEDTLEDYKALALLGAEALHQTSTREAADYLTEYRALEAGPTAAALPTRAGTFDALDALDALDLLGPLTKKLTAQGQKAPAALDNAYRLLGPRAMQGPVCAGGRDLVANSTAENPASLGWRRVTDGKPCAWCAMLATRGPAYNSPESAGAAARYHHLCGCTAEEVFGSWFPSDDEWRYLDAYENAWKPGDTDRDVAARMRAGAGDLFNDATLGGAAARKAAQQAATKKVVEEVVEEVAGFLAKAPRLNPEDLNTPEGLERLRAGTNPNWARGNDYSINCQRVVHSYELRRRGFDVTALPNPGDGSARVSEFLSWLDGAYARRMGSGRWVVSADTLREIKKFDPKLAAKLITDPHDYIEKAALDWPVGARGYVDFYRDKGSGHIFNIERTADGVVVHEAQLPRARNTDLAHYTNQVKRTRPKNGHLDLGHYESIFVTRVDDLSFNEDVLKAVTWKR